jgi:hypothetical protein
MLKELILWLTGYLILDIICILKLFSAPEYIPNQWYVCAIFIFPISFFLTAGLLFGIALELIRRENKDFLVNNKYTGLVSLGIVIVVYISFWELIYALQ